MRFGHDFYRHQVPRWADSYINYDGLKQLVKRGAESRTKPAAVREHLDHELESLNQFVAKQGALIDRWFQAVLGRFGVRNVQDFEGLDITTVAKSELQDLSSNLTEILDFVAQLDTFCQINRDASRRLSEKARRVAESDTLLDTARSLNTAWPWAAASSRVRGLLGHIERESPDAADSAEASSLLLMGYNRKPLEDLHRSIYADDSSELMCVLSASAPDLESRAALDSILQIAILYQSSRCIQSLLGEIAPPPAGDLGHHGDTLHQLIIQSARGDRKVQTARQAKTEDDVVEEYFRELSPYQHHMLREKDWRGRYPLHYAAQHGYAGICAEIVKFTDAAAMLEPDDMGETPLMLAVCSGHLAVVESLLDHEQHQVDAKNSLISEQCAAQLLTIAIQSRHLNVADRLIKFGKGLNLPVRQGQTPLYVAARLGEVEVVQSLIAALSGVLNLNTAEDTRQWTPLIVASVHGHDEVVQQLLLAGADANRSDLRGWTAVDHASFRAYMTIVTMMQEKLDANATAAPKSPVSINPAPSASDGHIQHPTSFSGNVPASVTNSDFASVFVNPGTFDLCKQGTFLDLESTSTHGVHLCSTEDRLVLEISGTHCQEPPYELQFPILGDLTSTLWRFSSPDPENMRLTFKLFRLLEGAKSSKALVGTAMILLGSIKGWFRPGRQSLRRHCTVALIGVEGDFIGSLTFTFLVCGSYKPPKTPGAMQHMSAMPPKRPTQVIGHRGLGWNDEEGKRLQIGEHTYHSLASALANGADLIEFDVQVTRDKVPVIYHDWFVSETGLDIPIHAMTYAQWMAISDAQSAYHDAPRGRLPWDERTRPSMPDRRTSRSVCAHPNHGATALVDRMKHTVEHSKSHVKGNIRGRIIHDTFVTLRQLFEKFPEDVTFDIELKYPMLWETDYWEMEPYATEMNEYIDTILDIVFELGGNRPIFFTCFNPEVCIFLSTKQKTYPVIFLNDSMVSGPAGDTRAISLQQAIHFARKWDLQGVVMAAEPFVAAPKLIQLVKSYGLYCGSYGSLNDIPEFAQKQASEGIDALIVNNVRLISNALRSSSEL